jgi:putative membrane protein
MGPRTAVKRATSIFLAIAGVGLAVAIVVWLGAGKVVRAVLSVGWGGFALIVLWSFVLFGVLALAWRLVCRGSSYPAVLWGRLVREGGSNILPFSEVGGVAFGARALVLARVPWARALASSIADVSAEFIGEIPFMLFGLTVIFGRRGLASILVPLCVGLGLLAAAVAGLVWAETHSARVFRALGRRIAARTAKKRERQADALQGEFDRIFSEPRRMIAAAGIHFLGWLGGGVTVWLTYRFLGGHIGLVPAIAIEGLLSGALAVAFLIPGGLGVQEASYVALGHLFGMPAHMSLGLSFLRRARDIVVGAPALLSWQIAEARQLRKHRPGECEDDSAPLSPGPDPATPPQAPEPR